MFLLYSPNTAVPSVDAFSAKRYYGASAYGGYKSLASANKYMAPVNKQVFFFLSPQHCAIGKARFLANPLCGLHIQSALPLFRKAGFSEVKGKLNSAKRYYGLGAYGGYKSLASANKKLAPVIKQVFLLYSPATALSAKHDFWLTRFAARKYNRLCLFAEKQAFRQ